jgi:FKBP-type peptidyl-prolyl cis-trans isomerase FkpA
MKLKLPLIAAMFAIASLSACGGGSDAPAPPPVPVFSPAALTMTDTTVGTGAVAVPGKALKVHYTLYLYTTATADFKGTKVETSVGATPFPLTLGVTGVIAGFEQGVTGMKVGGKRTVLIPAALAYGASGTRNVPPNSGLVFDLELMEVK